MFEDEDISDIDESLGGPEYEWQRLTREQWQKETDRVVEAGLRETAQLRTRVKALEANMRAIQKVVDLVQATLADLEK